MLRTHQLEVFFIEGKVQQRCALFPTEDDMSKSPSSSSSILRRICLDSYFHRVDSCLFVVTTMLVNRVLKKTCTSALTGGWFLAQSTIINHRFPITWDKML
jgi:hypothetical protein